jgi:CPA2 family monovalent cation:H+ antiporter-2
MNPALPVIVSTNDTTSVRRLAEVGATHVLPENLAAGLGLAEHLLRALGMSPQGVDERINQVRTILSPARPDIPRQRAEAGRDG